MIIEKKDRLNIGLHRIMAKAQAKLHLKPSVIVLLDWDILDKDGKPLLKHTGKSHSVTRNYSNVCSMQGTLMGSYTGTTYAAGSNSIKNRSGTLYNPTGYVPVVNDVQTANLGVTTKGIVLGTGATAESFDDYRVSPLIAHGTGTGQLSYAAQTALSFWDGGTRVASSYLQRAITNNSAASITANEIGVYCYIYPEYRSGGPVGTEFCIIRDVPTPIVIAPTTTIVIKYTFSYQFP